MELGIISWINETDFKKAKERNLSFVELDVNEKSEEFLSNIERTKEYSNKYEMPIAAVGKWGGTRITTDGINNAELETECALINAASKLGAKVYMTGCNYIDGLSYYENCQLAISYFERLIACGEECNVKIATYNCRWDNFVCNDMAWTVIHGYLKNLYIKYDVSHCVYDGGDYLSETKKWGERFAHVHIKGFLMIDGERVDDPPAGLDQTDWRAFLALLYAKNYQGGLSIEPHSPIWVDELGERGIDYTIRYMRNLMI